MLHKLAAKEVIILCTVLSAVKETFEWPGLNAVIELNAEAQLLPCISDISSNYRRTLRKLRSTLHELDIGVESGNIVRKGAKHV